MGQFKHEEGSIPKTELTAATEPAVNPAAVTEPEKTEPLFEPNSINDLPISEIDARMQSLGAEPVNVVPADLLDESQLDAAFPESVEAAQ